MIMKRLLSYGDGKCGVRLATRKSGDVTRGVEMDLLSRSSPAQPPARRSHRLMNAERLEDGKQVPD